ncbi:MAG: DNA polymerase III subunit beta [Lachnospirales bacterium]
MKIQIDRDLLQNNINLVMKAVASKGSMPILEYILLTANSSGLKLLGNDLKIAIETNYIDCQIDEMGIIALEAKFFFEAIRKLPSGVLSLESDDNNVTLKSGKAKITFKGLKGDDFPSIQEVEEQNKLNLNIKEFTQIISKTKFAVSKDDSKAILTGELFEVADNKLKVVAIDGFRISYGEKSVDDDREFSVIIPIKALEDVVKILSSSSNDEFDMIFSDNFVKFVTEDCIIVSRLISGDFIKYNQLFIEDYKTKITCNRSDLKDSLERTLLVSTDSKRVPVKFEINENVTIITSNTENGNSYEEIPIVFEGEDITIGFNPKFIIDVLNAIECEEVSLTFTNNLSPCIIRGISNDEYKYIVLPLRI